MSIRRVLSRQSLISRASGMMRGGDHHHGPRMLPFARLAPFNEKIDQEADFIWDDGVAPETAVDIELPSVPFSQVVTSQLAMALFLFSIYGFVSWLDIEKNVAAAPRKLALPSRDEMNFDDNHGRG